MGKTFKDRKKHDRSYYEGNYDKKANRRDLESERNLRNNKKNKRNNYDRESDEE